MRDGSDAVTTTTIAREAGIPVGSIYRYFAHRNDVLKELHHIAYDEVTGVVEQALQNMKPGLGFRKTHEQLIHVFWKAARNHPSFRALTRWANAQGSLWEVTPGLDSSLGQMVMKTIEVAGISLPSERQSVMLRTALTTLSVLSDQAIEEEDEDVAEALIEEITILLARYLD